jgi:hypothetical protein
MVGKWEVADQIDLVEMLGAVIRKEEEHYLAELEASPEISEEKVHLLLVVLVDQSDVLL